MTALHSALATLEEREAIVTNLSGHRLPVVVLIGLVIAAAMQFRQAPAFACPALRVREPSPLRREVLGCLWRDATHPATRSRQAMVTMRRFPSLHSRRRRRIMERPPTRDPAERTTKGRHISPCPPTVHPAASGPKPMLPRDGIGKSKKQSCRREQRSDRAASHDRRTSVGKRKL
jgi:hypothetical protein